MHIKILVIYLFVYHHPMGSKFGFTMTNIWYTQLLKSDKNNKADKKKCIVLEIGSKKNRGRKAIKQECYLSVYL